jgi:hypothetical protein
MSPVKTHLTQGHAALLEIGAVHYHQIELFLFEMTHSIVGLKREAGSDAEALNRKSDHVR